MIKRRTAGFRFIESYQKLYESHDLAVRVQALEQRSTEAAGTELVAEAGVAPLKPGLDAEESRDAK